ncbi:MAG: hypothetical protein ABSB70_07500 [Candidatus Velthaea sp.]
MKRSPRAGHPADAGFLLIEAVVAVALIAMCAGAALAAVAAVTHAAAHTRATPALTLTAQNILTDLRAATAYDPDALAAMAGRSIAFDAAEPGPGGVTRSVHIVANVIQADANKYVGFVTARAADGTAVTVQATLVQEAPAPGSVISASQPADAARLPSVVTPSGPIPL